MFAWFAKYPHQPFMEQSIRLFYVAFAVVEQLEFVQSTCRIRGLKVEADLRNETTE